MDKMAAFPAGATYAPLAKATEVDIAEWDSDLKTMAGLGLNTFRLFIAWDRIERKHGEKDFSKVDHAFELAAKHGLKLIANVGGTFANLQAIYPPRWLLTELGCQQALEKPGQSHESPIPPRIKLCGDDPVYQKEALAFIKEAVERYKSHPSLLAWSGWNEPRVPICFCPKTLAAYRKWLKDKYGNLETLGAAWSTEFPLSYGSWDEIAPQLMTGFEHGGYAAWLDWRKFCQQSRADKFRLIATAIKEADPQHPVISHLCGPHDADIFDCEDIGGVSIYTYFWKGGERVELSDAELCRSLNWSCSLMSTGYRRSRKEPDSFWVVETEAGPVSWVHNLMPKTYSGRKMNARDMIFVGHGSRCLLRWLYRSRVSDAQAGEFNLVGWDGSETERAIEFGKLSKALNANAELFLSNVPANVDVGVLCHSDDVKSLFAAEEAEHKYAGLPEFWIEALSHAGFPCRALVDRQVFEGELSKMKALAIPMRPYIDARLASILRDFVEKGGLLIVEAPFATKGMDAIHWRKTPGAGLDEVFGAQVYDLEKTMEEKCGGIPAFDFKAIMRTKGCATEAKFSDGTQAITSSKFGKGRTLMFNSVVSARYDWKGGAALRKILEKHLAAVKARPWHSLRCEDKGRTPETSVLYRALPDGRTLLTVVNFSAEASKLNLKLERFDASARIELAAASDEKPAKKINGNEIEFDAKPYGWAVFTIDEKVSI